MTPHADHLPRLLTADRREWAQPDLADQLRDCQSCQRVVARLDAATVAWGHAPDVPAGLTDSVLDRLRDDVGLATIPPPPDGLVDSVLAHVATNRDVATDADTASVEEPTTGSVVRLASRRPSVGRVLAVVGAAAAVVLVAAVAIGQLVDTAAPGSPLVALADATAAQGAGDVVIQSTTTVDVDTPAVSPAPLSAPNLDLTQAEGLTTSERIAELAAAGLGASREVDSTVATAQRRVDQVSPTAAQNNWIDSIEDPALRDAVTSIEPQLDAIIEPQRSRATTAVEELASTGTETSSAMSSLGTGRRADLSAAQDALSAFRADVSKVDSELALLEQALSPTSVIVQSSTAGQYQPGDPFNGERQVSYGVNTSQGPLLSAPSDPVDPSLDPSTIFAAQDDVLDILRVATPTTGNRFTLDLDDLSGDIPDALADLAWEGTVQEQDGTVDGIVLTGQGGPTTVDLFIDIDQP